MAATLWALLPGRVAADLERLLDERGVPAVGELIGTIRDGREVPAAAPVG